MNKSYALALLLLLCACKGGSGPIDFQTFVNNVKNPTSSKGNDAPLEDAQNAEKYNDFSKAARLYKQALDKKPGDPNITLSLADCYRRSGNLAAALPLYDALLAQNPDNVDAKEGKGLTLMAQGDFTTSGTLLEEVMKVNENRWKTLNGIGILFTTHHMQPEAQEYFEAALKVHPGSAAVMNNLGLSQGLDHQYDTALATLHSALAVTAEGGDEHRRIELNMALAEAVSGKAEEAAAIAQKYYSGTELDSMKALYAHVAMNDTEGQAYLSIALVGNAPYPPKPAQNAPAAAQNLSPGSGAARPPLCLLITH